MIDSQIGFVCFRFIPESFAGIGIESEFNDCVFSKQKNPTWTPTTDAINSRRFRRHTTIIHSISWILESKQHPPFILHFIPYKPKRRESPSKIGVCSAWPLFTPRFFDKWFSRDMFDFCTRARFSFYTTAGVDGDAQNRLTYFELSNPPTHMSPHG